MNLQAQNESAQTETGNVEESKEKGPTMQDLKQTIYGPAELDKAQEAIGTILELCEVENMEPTYNFDTEEELPDQYSIAIIPLTKRVKDVGNVVEGVCIAAIPSLEALISANGGQDWVRKLVYKDLTKTVKLAVSGDEVLSLPHTVTDFLSSGRSNALSGFNVIAPIFVKTLKEKGLKFMTKILLRQVMASQAFAGQQFPSIPKEKWEIVLQSMIAHASKEGEEAGVMAHWLATRDQVEVTAQDIDLSDFEKMVDGSEEDETVEQAEEVAEQVGEQSGAIAQA